MLFNPDGSLMAKKVSDHYQVLRLVNELDFPLGKTLIAKTLRGEIDARIKKFRLDQKLYFACLGGYSEDELKNFITRLVKRGLLQVFTSGKFPVITLTENGRKELVDQRLEIGVDGGEKKYVVSPITSQDKKLFEQLDFFLKEFTDEQKKAIICMDKKQLCIAGAGSGKTSVLTNKIKHLINHCGVSPEKILGVTFTKKAKQEMIERLRPLDVKIETFNSFAEKQLLKNVRTYEKSHRMVSSREFVSIVRESLQDLGLSVEELLEEYFLPRQRGGKDSRELFFSFLYDFRTILESYCEGVMDVRIRSAKISEANTAKTLVRLAKNVHEELHSRGLRTFSDQLTDCISLFKEHSALIPKYEWVLVDEYQDVNDEQVELLSILKPSNLFAVGDPRQAIYAWRGSNPDVIFDFIDDTTSVIELTKNFRSDISLVKFSNNILKGYTDLVSNSTQTGDLSVNKYDSDMDEARAIVDIILTAKNRSGIFVLSRTNKGLDAVRNLCDERGIAYLLRTDEKSASASSPRADQITLSTVHAIKGLEADIVFVIGCQNYPCKAKDHRFVEMLAPSRDYDQYEEERRILYVACTRAKHLLYVSYVGFPSPFLPKGFVEAPSKIADVDATRKALRRWRYLEAQDRGIPPYMVFSDKVLESLLEFLPMTVDELSEIPGLGRAKITEFGADIIRIMYK